MSQPNKVETTCSKPIRIPKSDPQKRGTKSKPIEVRIPKDKTAAAAKSQSDSKHVEFVDRCFSIGWAVIIEFS
jgi:hypothetical protein